MYRFLLAGLTIVCGLSCSNTTLADEPGLPHWLTVDSSEETPYRLSAEFALEEPALKAQLKLAADFASAKVSLNGREAITVEPYCQLQTFDVTHWLQAAENQLVIEVVPVAGPTAIAAELTIQRSSGRPIVLHSDVQWIASELAGEPLALQVHEPVKAEMWGAGRRDISLSPVENYEQWRQALTEQSQVSDPKFWIADGFEISLLHTATSKEGSWVSLTFDPQGRAIVSREDTGLLRMTLAADRTSVETVEAIGAELKECRGLVFHGDELYANANNSKGLYKLKISESGEPVDLQLVRDFPGGVGHGRNDLTVHGDWVYTIHGDSVDLPRADAVDLTSPFRHWAGDDSQHEGHLLRMHLPTGKWEVVCGGLRNPYGITIHSSGDAFTFDADNEFDMGTPWYRPTRLLALYPGGDIGYRTAGNKLPPRFHDKAENTPAVATIGRSSPTAVFYDNQLAFPPPYAEALYLLDWTYGRVIAVHLEPHGAGWRAQPELFLQGKPLNVTDVARGPDGAMYFVTGGRKTQSSLYRVSATQEALQNAAANTIDRHASKVAAFSQLQRQVRVSLEEISRNRDSNNIELIGYRLADADPVVRHAARLALERLPKNLWPEKMFAEDKLLTGLYAQLAQAQSIAPDGEAHELVDAWLAWDPVQLTLSQRFAWLRIGELIAREHSDLLRARARDARARLISAWPSTASERVSPEGDAVAWRHACAQLLAILASTESTDRVALDLLYSPRQEDQIAGLLALRQQKLGWAIADRQQQFELLREPSPMIGGQGLPTFLSGIKAASLETLSEAEKLALKEVLLPRSPEEQLSNVPKRAFVQAWQTSDLENLDTTVRSEVNLQRGAEIFKEALCIRCHRMGNRGSAIGPDLTFAGRRFGIRDLLDAMVAPSQSVAENYRLDVIVTEDGEIHTGKILVEGDYRSEKLRLQSDPLRMDAVIEIDKKEVAEHRQLERSPMPNGLLDHFTREEIRDLLAYLQNPLAPQ